MKYLSLISAGALALLLVASPVAPLRADEGAALLARAELTDGQGKTVGVATLTQGEKGVIIKLELKGMPAGEHAFHVHESGKCEGPDFKSSGGHFNPFGKKHGAKNPEGPHAGDLPNITVAADGTCTAEVTATLVTLAEGKNSLLGGTGTCLMIHEKADDETTDPAGNAGARIACGVIQKVEPKK